MSGISEWSIDHFIAVGCVVLFFLVVATILVLHLRKEQLQVFQNVHVTVSEMNIEAVHLQQISPDRKTMSLFERELLRAQFAKRVKFEEVAELKESNQSKTETHSSNQSKNQTKESPKGNDSNQSTTEMDVSNQSRTEMDDTKENPEFDRESVRFSDGKVISAKDTNLFQNAAARETLNVRTFPKGLQEIPEFPTATELVLNPTSSVHENGKYMDDSDGKHIESPLSQEGSHQSQHSEHSQHSQSLNCDDNEARNRSYSLQEADEVMKNIVSDLAYRKVQSKVQQEENVEPLPLIDTKTQDENVSNSTNRSVTGWENESEHETPRSRNATASENSDESFSVRSRSKSFNTMASQGSETVTNTFDLKRLSGYHPGDRRSFLNKLLRASQTNDAGKQIAEALKQQERHRASSDGSVSGSTHRNVPPYSCVNKLKAFKHYLEKSVEKLEDLADCFVGFENVDHPEGELVDDESYHERTGREDTTSTHRDEESLDDVQRKRPSSVRRRRSNSELQFLKDCQMEQRISDDKMQSSAWTKDIRRKTLARLSMQR